MRSQYKLLSAIALSIVTAGITITAVNAGNTRVDLGEQSPNSIWVNQAALYPEGLEYDAQQNRFLLS